MKVSEMNPCRNKGGEIICDHANLPYCRQTCEIYIAHEKERIEQNKTKAEEINNEINQYFSNRRYKTRTKYLKQKQMKVRK